MEVERFYFYKFFSNKMFCLLNKKKFLKKMQNFRKFNFQFLIFYETFKYEIKYKNNSILKKISKVL